MQLHSTYLVISPPTVVSLSEDDGQSFAQIVYVRLSTMVRRPGIEPGANGWQPFIFEHDHSAMIIEDSLWYQDIASLFDFNRWMEACLHLVFPLTFLWGGDGCAWCPRPDILCDFAECWTS